MIELNDKRIARFDIQGDGPDSDGVSGAMVEGIMNIDGRKKFISIAWVTEAPGHINIEITNESLWPFIAEYHRSDHDLMKLEQIRCTGERFRTIKEAYDSPYGDAFLILFKAFVYFVLDEFYPNRKKAYDDLVTW